MVEPEERRNIYRVLEAKLTFEKSIFVFVYSNARSLNLRKLVVKYFLACTSQFTNTLGLVESGGSGEDGVVVVEE